MSEGRKEGRKYIPARSGVQVCWAPRLSLGALCKIPSSVDFLNIMHRCLWIQEVLHNIFDNLADDLPSLETRGWPTVGHATLAQLARTCKAFTEPALDALWRFQPSLAPLVQCLPSHALRKIPHGGTCKLVRNIYASRLIQHVSSMDS